MTDTRKYLLAVIIFVFAFLSLVLAWEITAIKQPALLPPLPGFSCTPSPLPDKKTNTYPIVIEPVSEEKRSALEADFIRRNKGSLCAEFKYPKNSYVSRYINEYGLLAKYDCKRYEGEKEGYIPGQWEGWYGDEHVRSQITEWLVRNAGVTGIPSADDMRIERTPVAAPLPGAIVHDMRYDEFPQFGQSFTLKVDLLWGKIISALTSWYLFPKPPPDQLRALMRRPVLEMNPGRICALCQQLPTWSGCKGKLSDYLGKTPRTELIQDGFGPHSVVIRRVWSIPCDTGVALFDAITGELAGVSACNIPPLVD